MGQTVEVSGSSPYPWTFLFGDTPVAGSDSLDHRVARLHQGRRRLVWSVEDLATFAAAALWTYVQVPFVLAQSDVEVEPLGPWREGGETWLRLSVTFPHATATHCPRQVLYVDDNYRLRRHGYTALAFGGWARAAQYLSAYRDYDGLSFPTRRRVYPRVPGARGLRGPQPVWIDVHRVVLR
ncbi:MAG: hypothetical protein ABR540_02000 [Acidimicrobiales bacterium]